MYMYIRVQYIHEIHLKKNINLLGFTNKTLFLMFSLLGPPIIIGILGVEGGGEVTWYLFDRVYDLAK